MGGDVTNSQVVPGNKNVTGDRNIVIYGAEAQALQSILSQRSGTGQPPSFTSLSQFQSLIQDKTEGFVGREYVFDAIQAFIQDNKKGYITIIGDPGQGKSAILAKYVQNTGSIAHFILFTQNYATIVREFKDDYMQINYPERIDATARELKIILSQQRTITNRQKIQTLYWLKSGFSQSVTDVAERLGVHRVTVQRWLKQYSASGFSSLLKIRQSTGRYRVIPTAVISGISKKISEESCEFKSYKEIVIWVEDNYQLSVKYQILHKQVHYRMKAKLKIARRCSNKKDASAAIDFKKKLKNLLSSALWLESTTVPGSSVSPKNF